FTMTSSNVILGDESMDHDKVKREILYQLHINPETYLQAFRAKKKREEKDPRALFSKTDICNKILLEQFLTNLNEETQSWVQYHQPVSSAEALRLSENFSSAFEERPPDQNVKATPNEASSTPTASPSPLVSHQQPKQKTPTPGLQHNF
uniref:SCAN box domain-containing protein n=1 Tax=Crocodylus porosus TaxID=8502 RepID=A0A7M4EVS5_CROPO